MRASAARDPNSPGERARLTLEPSSASEYECGERDDNNQISAENDKQCALHNATEGFGIVGTMSGEPQPPS